MDYGMGCTTNAPDAAVACGVSVKKEFIEKWVLFLAPGLKFKFCQTQDEARARRGRHLGRASTCRRLSLPNFDLFGQFGTPP
jgi:hypothetical protein